MGRYIVRRLLIAVPLLIGVSLILYFLMRLAPGGPEAVYGQNPHMRAEDIERLKALMGLNDPIHVAYGKWLWQFVQGNLGNSLFTGRSVGEMLLERIPNTVVLMGGSLVLSLVIGVTFGVISAIKQYSKFDYAVTTFAFFGYSMPTFWFGILMMMVFAANDYTISLGGHTFTFGHWLPAAGMFSAGFEGGLPELMKAPTLAAVGDLLLHMILPTAVLCIVSIASWSRFSRSSMLEVIRMDYIRMARAKGLGEWVINFKHALKNAAIPIATITGLQFGMLLSGAIITETIFAWPGIGSLSVGAIFTRDFPVLQGCAVLFAVSFVLVNLATDVVYTLLDPRLRAGQ